MGLTIFSTPKPFHGPVAESQMSAIRSWTLLEPRPEIILIGNDAGTADICRKLDLRHIPQVERNEFGTPLVRSVFALGQEYASNPFVCYLNSDIIVMGDFAKAVWRVAQLMDGQRFLLIGGRWNVERLDPLMLGRPSWETELRDYLANKGWQDRKIAMDYFLFPRDCPWDIPAFAIGRSCWDSWFPFQGIAMRIPVIDGTDLITVVHQDHDYAHVAGTGPSLLLTPEGRRNLGLLGIGRRYTIEDATYVLTRDGLMKRRRGLQFWAGRLKEVEVWGTYHLTGPLRPYAYPVYRLLRGCKHGLRSLARALRDMASHE